MKQLIVLVAIIVALFAFFVIVDHKEFSHNKDIQTVQGTNNTKKKKRRDTVSSGGDGRIGDHRQVIAAWLKVTEHDSADDGSEKEPAETKSIEIRSNTDINYPVAVPVITAEEAIRANEEALRLHQEIEIR